MSIQRTTLSLVAFVALTPYLSSWTFSNAANTIEDLNCNPEYVVVGSGCSGGIVGSRLASAGKCVVLLERGFDDNYSETSTIGLQVDLSIPSIHWLAQPQFAPDIAESIFLQKAWQVDRQWKTLNFTKGAPDNFSEWQMIFNLVGGGSSGNAMVYNRGNRKIFDSWDVPGWTGEILWPKYEELEEFMGPFENSEGTAAPEAFVVLDAFRDVHGWEAPPLGRLMANGDESLVGFYDKAIKGGLRSSVPRNFLTPEIRDLGNFVLVTEAQVTKVLFDGNKAVGVAYIKGGLTKDLLVEEEVILSAGPYSTPTLLLKSGVGPKKHLKKRDIPVVSAVKGVGRNYKNHLFVPLVVNLKQPYSDTILNPPLTSNGGDFIGHIYSDRCLMEECDAPDLQTAWSYYAGFAHYLEPPYISESMAPIRTDPTFNGTANLWVMCTQPESTGRIKLSAGKKERRISANFLSEERDVEVMVDGLRKVRAVAQSLPDFLEEIPLSQVLETDDELRDYVRRYAMGQYHPAGTAKMVKNLEEDPLGVVDGSLRVFGTEGLRVIDSSVMPRIQNGNPSAPAMLIGFYGADLILNE